MTKPEKTSPIAALPRPWLTREAGECAYPVEGDGIALRACCNPCGRRPYCPPHAAAMRGPQPTSAEALEREIIALLERSR